MNIQKVINNGLCLGCGFCSFDPKVKKMIYSKQKGMFIPDVSMHEDYSIANSICPGKGYKIIEKSSNLFSEARNYSIELGYYNTLYAAHSNNKKTLEYASSGGIMTEILIYLLKEKIVDKVAVTKFIYPPKGIRTKTFLTDDIQEIYNSQGSKYCPVDASEFVCSLKDNNEKFAYVGTPCQIASLRYICNINKNIESKLVITIANFCGGFKNYNQIYKISKRHSISYKDISFFRFRGGGQPGSMIVKDANGKSFEVAYPKYGGYTGYSKLLRCHLCVDATGELADICCGDAWLDRFLKKNEPWSIVICRTNFTKKIINEMSNSSKICTEDITASEVISSQKINISSKKERQLSRYKLYKLLGYKTPEFDGGYYNNKTSLKLEIKVFLTHKLKLLFEKIGLYPLFRKIIKKPY
jgi:coenzyme F420 hydrogenase subunit beta